jgi:hypothetical protein
VFKVAPKEQDFTTVFRSLAVSEAATSSEFDFKFERESDHHQKFLSTPYQKKLVEQHVMKFKCPQKPIHINRNHSFMLNKERIDVHYKIFGYKDANEKFEKIVGIANVFLNNLTDYDFSFFPSDSMVIKIINSVSKIIIKC